MTIPNLLTWLATGVALGIGYGIGSGITAWLVKLVRAVPQG